MNLLWRNGMRMAVRKMLEPEAAELAPFEEMFQMTSRNYDFVISRKPTANLIFEHDCSTPSGVLKKPGVHIFPETMPELNRRQKFSAVARQLESQYDLSYRKCSSPKEIFHLERKIKSEIRSKLFFVGCLDGKKHKHLLKFKPFMDILADTTQRQYEKNGINVEILGEKIYPTGKVWLPTSAKYLTHYHQIVSSITGRNDLTVLDVGCGSGVLSYLFAKQFKKSKIFGLDNNPDAVRTCNLNAARLQFRNIQALEFDLKNQKSFELKTMEYKLPKQFDWIVINPPWLVSSKFEGESVLTDGVYDNSDMLKNALKLSKRILAPDGHIIVIYSDLSEILGLSKQSLEQLCTEFGFLIEEKHETPLHEQMVKKSAIGEFKSRSKIVTYLLKRS